MMPTRKNKLLTMLFSLCPGAGHMFMGFMHLGLSYMILFFGTISAMVFLDKISYYFFEFIGFLLPIIWCYAFFDCLNKCYASDEEYYLLEDKFLFTDGGVMPKFHNFNFRLNRYVRLILGWILTISGGVLLLRNFMGTLARSELLSWDSYIYRFIAEIMDGLPRFIGAIAIVVLGLWLIFGKRRELEDLKSMMDQAEDEDYRHGRDYRTPEDISFSEGFQPPEDGKPSEIFKSSEIFKHAEEIQPTEEEKTPEIVLTLENEAALEDIPTVEDIESQDKQPPKETAEPAEAPQPASDAEDMKPLEETQEIQEEPEDSKEAQRHE